MVRVAGSIVALFLLFVAGPAAGQDRQDTARQFYLSAGGALVMPAEVRAGIRGSSGERGGMDVAFDAGHGLVLVMGYGQKWGLRGELELGYREFEIDRISKFELGRVADPGPIRVAGDVTSLSLMSNAVSSLDLGPVNFYVGGGIGIARVEGSKGIFAGGGGRDDVFAWQLFTGLQYHLSEDVSASLGYRYFVTEDARFGSAEAPIESHNLELNLTHWLN